MIRFLQNETPLKKVILGGLLVLICLAMAITLIPGIFDSGSSSPGVFARVGDQEVTSQEIQNTAKFMAEQNHLPEQFMSFVLPRAADQAVLKALLISEAHRIGLSVSDQELRDEFRNGGGQITQALFPGGKYIGDEAYKDLIQTRARTSVADFEKNMKNSLLLGKLQSMITGGVTVPDAEVQKDFVKHNVKVKFDYAVLTLPDVMKQVNVTEGDLRAFFEKNKAQYKDAIPEKRKARYAVLDTARLNITVTPEDLREYYSAHQDQFKISDRVNVRHILIKTPAPSPDGKIDDKAVQAARAQIEDVAKQLKAGGNFEELAKKYSQDSSASGGGSLGWLIRGQTVPEFEKAAFSTEKGKVSDIIKSTFGFHILRVDDKENAHIRTLEEVKAEIEPIKKKEKVERETEAISNTLQSKARTEGLEKAAAENHLDVVSTDYFARTDSLPGVGNAPEFMQAVFETKAKSPATTVRLPQGLAIVEVLDVRPPQAPKFEEIRARVEQDFRNERAADLLAKKTAELSEKARASHDLKKAAKEVGATVKTSELVDGQGQVPDLGSMSGPAAVAFNLAPGQISDALRSDRNGFVLSVLEKKEPTPEEFSKGKEQERESLLDQKRQEAFGIFAESLKTKMEKEGKVKYNAEERTRLLGNKPGQPGT